MNPPYANFLKMISQHGVCISGGRQTKEETAQTGGRLLALAPFSFLLISTLHLFTNFNVRKNKMGFILDIIPRNSNVLGMESRDLHF